MGIGGGMLLLGREWGGWRRGDFGLVGRYSLGVGGMMVGKFENF